MKDVLRRLVKLTKLHFYEHASKLMQNAKVINGRRSNEIENTETFEDVFSDESLIDGKYYYIQSCEVKVDEFVPTYKTRFIKLWPIDKVKRWLIEKISVKIARSVKEFELNTYIKDGLYLHKLKLTTYEGEIYEDKEIGENRVDSKLMLFNRYIKYLNHMKYEHRKKCKK